ADTYLKYYRSQKYYDSAGWRGTWALDGGGALMNQGVHGVDLLLWLVGEPVVSAYAKADHLVRDIEVEDTAVALLTFRSGAYGVIEGTTSVNPGEPTRIMLHGKLGTITIEESKIVRWATTTGQDDLAEDREVEVEEGEEERAMQDPTAIGMAGHIALVKDMARAVIEDREPMIPGEDARKAVDLILAIYESARTGEEVRL
ncbi:MAG TPA: Gfo/Idh/MocA family oxidoreductase, partial [Candidatus Latescibacteria bacterium]|nr:Gfo/Idh/MocA family oxidoreductase [Candidatus Latescibacterota bacterium]